MPCENRIIPVPRFQRIDGTRSVGRFEFLWKTASSKGAACTWPPWDPFPPAASQGQLLASAPESELFPTLPHHSAVGGRLCWGRLQVENWAARGALPDCHLCCQGFLEKSYCCQAMENMSFEELISHDIYKKRWFGGWGCSSVRRRLAWHLQNPGFHSLEQYNLEVVVFTSHTPGR